MNVCVLNLLISSSTLSPTYAITSKSVIESKIKSLNLYCNRSWMQSLNTPNYPLPFNHMPSPSHTTNPTPAAAILQTLEASVSHQTRARLGEANNFTTCWAARCRYPKKLIVALAFWGILVLEEETDQLLIFRQLCNHPKIALIWNKSFSNEMGRF